MLEVTERKTLQRDVNKTRMDEVIREKGKIQRVSSWTQRRRMHLLRIEEDRLVRKVYDNNTEKKTWPTKKKVERRSGLNKTLAYKKLSCEI